jgi:hypothetical protein
MSQSGRTPRDMLAELEEVLVEKRTAILQELFERRTNLAKDGHKLPAGFGWEKAKDVAEIQALIAAVRQAADQER